MADGTSRLSATLEPNRADAGTIREALVRLLDDPTFRASKRNRGFLLFIVEETLAGRASRIKSYTIAVDVFGRPADFDATTDPIVRIEATRLRAALAAYYAGPGAAEPLRFEIPKGSYVPSFQPSDSLPPAGADAEPLASPVGTDPRQADEPAAGRPLPEPAPAVAPDGPTRSWRKPLLWLAGVAALLLICAAALAFMRAGPAARLAPAILIEPVAAPAGDTTAAEIAGGLGQTLEMALSRFGGLRVFAVPADMTVAAAAERMGADAGGRVSLYSVQSNIRRDGDLLRFWWRLVDLRSGETVWAATDDRPWSGGASIPIEDSLAHAVAALIGQPGGPVARRELAASPATTTGYACVLRARAYAAAPAPAPHAQIRDCLEATVAATPGYTDAWAMLAVAYLDEARNHFNPRSGDKPAEERAEAAARRAVALGPYSELAFAALMDVAYRAGRFDEAERAGRRALELNPDNPELLSALGIRLFARGHWDEGVALVRRAAERSLSLPAIDRLALALDHYRRNEFELALKQIGAIDAPDFWGVAMVHAAVLGKLGRPDKARPFLDALRRGRPDYAREMRNSLRARHVTEPMIDMIADGLRKAGLDVQ